MRRLLLSETRGAGKTTRLLLLLEELIAAHIPVHGMINPGRFVQDKDGVHKKIGIDLRLLPSEKTVELAHPKEGPMYGRVPGAIDGNVGYVFNDDAIAAANAYFAELTERAHELEGVVIVDEIGPFEVVKNKGITEALHFLDNATFDGVAIITVRPEMLDKMHARWPEAEDIKISDLSISIASS